MPRTLLLVAYLATGDAFVAPLRRVETPLAAASIEGEKPKTPPLGANLVLPGDDDLNYGTTIVSCALASFLMLTAALPSDWQAPPANTREARAVKVEALLKQNKKLAKKDGRVIEVQGELSAFDKAEAFILPAAALFIVAPVLVQGRNLKQIYDYSRCLAQRCCFLHPDELPRLAAVSMRPLLIFGWLAACAGMSAPVSRGPKAAMPKTTRARPRGPAHDRRPRRRPLTLETARHLLNKGALSHDDAVAAVRSATRLAQSPAPRHKTRPTRNDVDAFVRDVLNAPSRDWEPTERLCAVALDAHARDGDVKATRQLIRAARSLGGVQPGPVSFCILIKAVGRRGEKLPSGREKRTLTKSVDEAIKGCARNSVPDAVLLNAAVDAYARLGAVDDALHLVGSFGDYGVQADARAYNAALKALVRRPRDALALRRRMRDNNIRPTAVTNATLINTIALHNPARAQRLLQTLVRDDFARDSDALNAATAAYTSVVGAFASQGAERAAYDVAGLMRRRSVPQNAVTFAELFRAAATATKGSKRARRIRGLWRRLTKDRIRPTRGCYDVAIASLIGDVPDPACLRLALDLSATMRADVGWSTTTLNLILAALYASDARAKEARSTYDAPVASDRNAKLRAAERLFDRAERDPRTCAPPDCATYTIALRARARRGDLDGCRQAFRSLRDSPTLSVDNVAATSMLVALARAGALSEMWRLLEDMRNVEMCEDLPTPDADAVEVVVRALARARSGVAADKAIALYERHFGTRGDLGAPSEACVQAVLLACARKAPPPKGLFDLKRSVRDDVKAAREVLDGLEGRLPSDTVRDLRQYARETLAQCETETWRDGAGQRPGGRWTEPESASDRLFSQKGWNSVDSGFKLF